MAERTKKTDYLTTANGKFTCLVCSKILSSKQRILQHLHLLHNFSPVKPVKKLYKYDSSFAVPRRTLFRHAGLRDKCSKGRISTSTSAEEEIEVVHEESVENIQAVVDSKHIHLESSPVYQPKETACTTCLSLNSTENNVYKSGDESDSSNLISSDSSDSENDFSESNNGAFSSDNSTSDEEAGDTLVKNEVENDSSMLSFGIAAYTRRYNCSKASTESLLTLIKALNPESQLLNDITYKKVFADLSHSAYKVIHYCERCLSRFQHDADVFQCSTAGCQGLRYIGNRAHQLEDKRKPRAFYIICDVGFQLKLLLEKECVLQEILSNKEKANQNSAVMSDIYQGKAYQDLYQNNSFLSSPYNISGLLNTDGIPLYNSSKIKLWPVFISINELSVFHRFIRGNTLLAGIWQGSSSPPFLEYLKSVGEELQNLYDSGIKISTKDGEQVVKLCVCLATMDLQAKSYASGMSMHNGAYGCITCEEPGETVRQGRGHRKSYPYRPHNQKPPIRNSDDVKYVKGPAASRSNRIKGVCGLSGFNAMPWFDLVNGMTPDYMHGVLMGVTKTLLYLWFSPTHSGKQHFIGKSLSVINNRLKKINPPSSIQRLPRDLEKHYNNLKATELQIWLLFYAYPCLKSILPDKYLEHFCMLSEGIYLLLGDSVTSNELTRAERLLDEFYKSFSDLYGQSSCGLNIHNVCAHLVYYVRLWGPLYCWSCFGFEDNNADILKSVHGTGDVTRQIINNKLADLYIRSNKLSDQMKEIPVWCDFLSKVCPDTSSTKEIVASASSFNDQELVISAVEKNLVVQKIGASNTSECKVYNRIVQQGSVLYSESYRRMKRRNCYTFLCENETIIAVKYFVENSVKSEKFAVGNKANLLEPQHPFMDVGHHLVKIQFDNVLDVISTNELKEELFVINPCQTVGCYISRVPNLYGKSVFK